MKCTATDAFREILTLSKIVLRIVVNTLDNLHTIMTYENCLSISQPSQLSSNNFDLQQLLGASEIFERLKFSDKCNLLCICFLKIVFSSSDYANMLELLNAR